MKMGIVLPVASKHFLGLMYVHVDYQSRGLVPAVWLSASEFPTSCLPPTPDGRGGCLGGTVPRGEMGGRRALIPTCCEESDPAFSELSLISNNR